MSKHDQTTVVGDVAHVFAHRFVVTTASGAVLADLGPKGAEAAKLTVGERVELVGEMKPSELKVAQLVRPGQAPVAIEHPKPKHEEPKPKHGDAKPEREDPKGPHGH